MHQYATAGSPDEWGGQPHNNSPVHPVGWRGLRSLGESLAGKCHGRLKLQLCGMKTHDAVAPGVAVATGLLVAGRPARGSNPRHPGIIQIYTLLYVVSFFSIRLSSRHTYLSVTAFAIFC